MGVFADLAREAFAQGFAQATARQPFPLTARAILACETAAAAADSVPPPDATPTLRLGQLEGLWAVIYGRREAIEQLHGKALQDVLTAMSKLDWQIVINRAASYLLTNPGISGADLARLLSRDVQNLIAQDLPYDTIAQWRQAMVAALTDATAEGQTAAVALIGDAAGISIDWELAATAAKDALANNQVIYGDAGSWMERQIHGLSYQLSQRIAKEWEAGTDPATIEQEIEALLDVTRSTAAILLDTAIGQALSAGALATYTQAGVLYIDFVTAGDGRVCAACGDAEDNGPYPSAETPQPPLHVRCRCTVSPSDYIPTSVGLALAQTYADTSDLTDAEAA